MADEEERIKAEKLAAAKKRVAQLQKQKKKASKKASTATDTPKDAETPKEVEATPEPAATTETTPPVDTPAEESPQETTPADTTPADTTTAETTATEQPAEPEPEPESHEKPTELSEPAESPVEPMPPAPTSPGPETESQPARLDTPRAGHGRQPSLSIQSKMRSSSFRKTSISQGSAPSPSALKISPQPLPPLTGDGDSVHEVFRKQSTKIEELEKDNKRLEKELFDATTRWRKTEDQLEDLREASVDGAELRERLKQAEEKVASIEALNEEIASLQRQNSQLQSRSHRNNASASVPGTSESPPADLVRQLESKSATIEAMELEISNLRAQVTSQQSSNSAHETQVTALEEKLSESQAAIEKLQRELNDTKQALTRASEKAVKEGVDKTSTETLIKSLQREVEELKNEKVEGEKKIETLDKKLVALSNLHKESESRHQTRLRESEKAEKETAVLRKKLASIENENLRLREERDRTRKRDAGGTDDEALDELEDEERQRLERRIRELEGENFDLRRGVWQDKRSELAGQQYLDEGPESGGDAAANAFDDVDLVGGRPDHARRRSMALQQQHSSLSDVLSSGFAAFTGGNRARAGSSNPPHPATRGSLELLSEENLEDEFDEAEFARAQAEEEARKRVEWVREIKRKLRDWQGWRLDLVDSRAGAEGPGLALGQIFEV
ncbi:M protein repeat protein [Penicillium brasilianum]|uniref:M protein repeat protein n=1 Tax=Penicillium brasilianum TaxID=104259 RepID=A0A1S9S211_PENBI|nr:M protein repeat protein [Penicillium brasilianum]